MKNMVYNKMDSICLFFFLVMKQESKIFYILHRMNNKVHWNIRSIHNSNNDMQQFIVNLGEVKRKIE